MPFNLGPLELVIILVIALLILGPGKLPEVGSALGKSIKEFRKAATDVQEATSVDVSTTAAPATPPQAAPAAPVATAAIAPPAEPAQSAEPVPTVPAAAPQPNVLSDAVAPNEVASEPRA